MGGSYQISIKATNGVSPDATQSFTLTVAGSDLGSQFEALEKAVTGVGPGSSLLAKVQGAERSAQSGQVSATCGLLGGFINEIRAQSGKSISSMQAFVLIADAADIRTTLAC
jgi:hypothetical protein